VSNNFMQSKSIIKNSLKIGLCIFLLLMLVPLVQAASATADELHAAPLNPEFIRYVTEKSYDSQVQVSTQGLGLRPSPIYRPEIKDVPMFGSTAGDRSTSYPATYDLRTLGRVSPVKDQGYFGTCWAFATYGSLESTLMPVTPTPDFSEKNLVNLAGFVYTYDDGGTMWMSIAYLTRWNGPVNESTDPYPTGAWTTSGTYPPVKHVQNVVFFPTRTSRTDNDNIKGALTRWGAVYSSFYWGNGFYNDTHTSYYQPASAADPINGGGHAVTIVGWDDNYAATNFTTTAYGPGAWIVKNSWGTGWGSDGYFYVSYYDKYFGSAIDHKTYETAAVLGENTSNYDTVYSYDKLGEVNDYFGATVKTGSFANVFTANSSEIIKAVGFYTTDVNVPYTISIYKNPTTGPVGGTPAATFSGTLNYMGYNTVEIPSGQQVPVTTGDRFSVVVQVTNPTNNYYIPIEENLNGYTSGIVSQSGQGYTLESGGWTDLKTRINNSHVCVKAYTSSTTPTSTVGVFRNGTVYLAGSNTNGGLPVNTFNYGMTGDKPITGKWTGTGIDSIGIFRNGVFYLRNSNTGGFADTTFNYGQAGDVPITGDWTGSGVTRVGIFRSGTFFLASSNTPGGGSVNAFNFGRDRDVPVTGDWNADGKTEVGIFREGMFYLASSNSPGGGTVTAFNFGQAGDVPVTGDWNADGKTEVGIFRNGMVYQATSTGTLNNYFYYGMANDLPVGGYFG
jgi:C1A family cysteine protease